MQKQTTVYLGLGANLGNTRYNLQQALRRLSQLINFAAVSPLYDTAPVGNTSQPRFLNAVAKGTTTLTPEKLLVFAKSIEQDMGRATAPPDSPRPIDIDVLFYGHLVLSTANLTIPHPRLAERAFVLAPLADISPGLRHPVIRKTVKTLLRGLPRTPGDVARANQEALCLKFP